MSANDLEDDTASDDGEACSNARECSPRPFEDDSEYNNRADDSCRACPIEIPCDLDKLTATASSTA